MSRIVGLSRAIKLEWLDKTVELVIQGDDEGTIKEKLNEYLAFEINSAVNLRKTREILLNVWVRTVVTEPAIHRKAVEAYRNDSNNKLALHWAMLLLAYPVFADVVGLIGKISNLQDTFTTAWLKEKLYEQWGERTTLIYVCEKILQTLKYFGVIESVKAGAHCIKQSKVSNEHVISILIMSLLALERKAYFEIPKLSHNPLYFPFEFSVSMEWLHHAPDFTLENIRGKTVLSGK